MRHLEITKTMIRQSKEIWGLLEPGEFVPEPGDWIVNQSHGPEIALDIQGDDIRTWSTGWLEEDRVKISKPGVFPIFSFTHCLDLLRKRGLFYSISHLHGDLVRMKALLPGDKVLNAIGINYHECAQAVLLKVLKGGE